MFFWWPIKNWWQVHLHQRLHHALTWLTPQRGPNVAAAAWALSKTSAGGENERAAASWNWRRVQDIKNTSETDTAPAVPQWLFTILLRAAAAKPCGENEGGGVVANAKRLTRIGDSTDGACILLCFHSDMHSQTPQWRLKTTRQSVGASCFARRGSTVQISNSWNRSQNKKYLVWWR